MDAVVVIVMVVVFGGVVLVVPVLVVLVDVPPHVLVCSAPHSLSTSGCNYGGTALNYTTMARKVSS